MILTIWLISCQSNNVEKKYIVVYPVLDFPEYPAPKGQVVPLDENKKVVVDNETDIEFVLYNFDYFLRTITFKNNYDTLQEQYNNFIQNAKKLEIDLNNK